MKYIQNFAQLTITGIPIAGGKGANLGELTRAKIPVPPGFVVTTTAYERFVSENKLHNIIARELSRNKDGGIIRAAFLKAQIPNEIKQAITAAFQELKAKKVAVRSSATAEDLPEAAFAGQQDTFLNVEKRELLEAVKKVWASLWTERVIAYRERLGIDPTIVKIAVVVQRMVEAEVAGVMFTANTITGARDEVTIDANPGLGEAVVSGEVTPEHYILKKQLLGWRVIERRKGERETHLNDSALFQLANLGRVIERHFGTSQDIEFAWKNGKPFILQTRPITALPSPPPKVTRLKRFAAANLGEVFAFRPYPLDMDTWIAVLAEAIDPLFELLGMRWRLKDAFEQDNGVVTGLSEKFTPRPTWRVLLVPFRLISLARRNDPLNWQSDPNISEALSLAREMETRDLSPLSWKELLKMLDVAKKITYLAAGDVRRRYFPGAALAAIRLRIFLAFISRGNEFVTLLSGVSNKTIEANHELEKLADMIRSGTKPDREEFKAQFKVFLDRFGHRESVLGSAHEPTWKDNPEAVLGMIRSFAAHPREHKAEILAWQKARNEILQYPLLRLAFFRSSFLKILEKARLALQIREDTHFYATLSMPIFRRILLECGRRLVRIGLLEQKENVFHLTYKELDEIDDTGTLSPFTVQNLRAAVLRRKRKRAELEGKPLVDPRIFMSKTIIENAILTGMAGSPGIAEGPARIVRNTDEFKKLSKGDVLVAPFTNPAWTPLFERASAVVVDSGSVGSHAAITAREYGIPAVMGTVEGTTKLRDGLRLRVDGTRGVVFAIGS